MKILLTEKQLNLLINLLEENNNKINVLFVGDSLSSAPGITWNYLIANSYPNWNSTHIAQGGAKTSWMLDKLLTKLKEKKYDKVFIWGGTNDAFSSSSDLSESANNIQKMVDAVNKQGGKAYVFLGYDAASVMVDENLKPTKYCSKSCMFNAKEKWIKMQKEIGSQVKNCVIIPTIEGDKTWAPGDGIHIGGIQHKMIKNHIEKYIGDDSETKIKINKDEKTTEEKKDEKTTEEKKEKILTRDKFDKFLDNFFNFVDKKTIVNTNSDTNDIKRMQIILSLITKKPLTISGNIDLETEKLLKLFQKTLKINESGVFDLETQEKMSKIIKGEKVETLKNEKPKSDGTLKNDDNKEIKKDDNKEIEKDDKNNEIFKTLEACNFGKNSRGNKRKVVFPPDTDIKFYQDILKELGTNVTCEKMLFFFAWRSGEASPSSYNPFATTQRMRDDSKNTGLDKEGCYYNCLANGRGYKPIGCRSCPSGTNPGVKNYTTYSDGLKATVKTLTNGRYKNVVRKLKDDNSTAYDIASEVGELNTWGTGGLVIEIIKRNNTIKPNPIKK
jgi:hypothetical protein